MNELVDPTIRPAGSRTPTNNVKFKLDWSDPVIKSDWFRPKPMKLAAIRIVYRFPGLAPLVYWFLRRRYLQSDHPLGDTGAAYWLDCIEDGVLPAPLLWKMKALTTWNRSYWRSLSEALQRTPENSIAATGVVSLRWVVFAVLTAVKWTLALVVSSIRFLVTGFRAVSRAVERAAVWLFHIALPTGVLAAWTIKIGVFAAIGEAARLLARLLPALDRRLSPTDGETGYGHIPEDPARNYSVVSKVAAYGWRGIVPYAACVEPISVASRLRFWICARSPALARRLGIELPADPSQIDLRIRPDVERKLASFANSVPRSKLDYEPAVKWPLWRRVRGLGLRAFLPFSLLPQLSIQGRLRCCLEAQPEFVRRRTAELMSEPLGPVSPLPEVRPHAIAGLLPVGSDYSVWRQFLETIGFKPRDDDDQETAGQRLMLNYILDTNEEDTETFAPLTNPDPRNRSVLFLNNSYYHFYYLAKALRDRGWHAHVLSGEDPESDVYKYYHGVDVNYFSPDSMTQLRREVHLFRKIPRNYRMIHFYSEIKNHVVFPGHWTKAYNFARDEVPWDFIELRRRGVKIGFSCAGCMTLTSKSAFYEFTDGVCENCAWRAQTTVCADETNLAAAAVISGCTDLICSEAEYTIGVRGGRKGFREPLTYCLDDQLWRPDLEVPEHMRFDREPGELIVMHSVGNFESRSVGADNIKGTRAILDAIERLQAEGHKVRLEFKTNVKSSDMRFYQVQADILVDQIRYGRYGATARESMMLGKPTICALNPKVPSNQKPMRSISECPLVHATPETVYDVLKDLILHPEKRRKIGEASRAYAVKWHSPSQCAERFERVYDRLQAGKRPEHDSVFADS